MPEPHPYPWQPGELPYKPTPKDTATQPTTWTPREQETFRAWARDFGDHMARRAQAQPTPTQRPSAPHTYRPTGEAGRGPIYENGRPPPQPRTFDRQMLDVAVDAAKAPLVWITAAETSAFLLGLLGIEQGTDTANRLWHLSAATTDLAATAAATQDPLTRATALRDYFAIRREVLTWGQAPGILGLSHMGPLAWTADDIRQRELPALVYWTQRARDPQGNPLPPTQTLDTHAQATATAGLQIPPSAEERAALERDNPYLVQYGVLGADDQATTRATAAAAWSAISGRAAGDAGDAPDRWGDLLRRIDAIEATLPSRAFADRLDALQRQLDTLHLAGGLESRQLPYNPILDSETEDAWDAHDQRLRTLEQHEPLF